MKPYILSAAICMGLLASCADNDMTQLSTSEPSSLSTYDYLSSYDVLKSYADFKVGVNMDATTFLAGGVPYRIAVSNFNELIPDLTFSHASVMKASGSVDTTKFVKVINQATAQNISVFGYPLISNTNQNSTYLSSRLEPNVIRPTGDTGGYGLKMTNTIKMQNTTDAQVGYTFARTPSVEPGIRYKLTFMVRGTATGKVQCSTYSNSRGSYFTPEFTVTTKWTKVSMFNSMASGITGLQSILFNIGQYVGTLYVDNIELYELDDMDEEASDNLNTLNENLDDAETTAKSVSVQTSNSGLEDVGVSALGEGYDPLATYVDKSKAEKDSILKVEMNTYLGGVMDRAKSSITEWGVVCNPLDSTNIATSGNKTLGSGEFYWADYMDKDFAVSAFNVAAKHCNDSDKLYICESGMEDNLDKCTALLDYVEYIKGKGARVDGIGTTIHVSTLTADRDRISTLLYNLASKSKGKMVKITDLKVDIAGGVLTDSAYESQMKAQSDLYEYIVTTYKKQVPAAQRGGIIQSTLLDTSKSSLGLWSTSYSRKHAYGGFVKGLQE